MNYSLNYCLMAEFSNGAKASLDIFKYKGKKINAKE